MIDSVIDHTIIILKYNRLGGRNYIKLPKELDHPKKGLINIQNTDEDECFKWCLVRHRNLASHHPARITKTDNEFARRLDFKDIKIIVKIRDIQKIENKIMLVLMFLAMKTRKNIQSKYQKMLKRNRCL